MTYPSATPVVDQNIIRTTDAGLNAGSACTLVNGFDLPFYFAAPTGGNNLPVVLVVQEIFGLHEHIRDVCRRLAHQGYLALAPELYARQGDASQFTEIPKLMAEIVTRVPDSQVMADLDGVLRWASDHGGDVSRAGVTGFCWGGRITWLFAAHNQQIRTGVAWYGRLTGPSTEFTPRHPVSLAEELRVPVLGLYGGQDAGIPMDNVEEMKSALAQAGSTNTHAADSRIVVYPDAPHAFFADYRPSYRKVLAEDGFERMLTWFKDKGVA